MQTDWDYIVVGSGSAGAAVASRLSEDGKTQVLLLEAGRKDTSIIYKVPILGPMIGLKDKNSDWGFKTEADPSRQGRIDHWPRGKVLGGSSSINGTIYVRGNRGDYDHWRQLGNVGWSYDDMVPVFKRLERNEDGASDVYGKNGAVVVSETRGPHPLTKVFVEAVSEVTGCPPNPDYNGEVQVGASVAHVTQKNGWRYSTSRAYLAPARHRANLKIVTHAEVARVVFEGKVAVGVEARIDGELRVLRARREVLLSAGSINSPKLLMLSGIGDPAKLGQFGIPVVHANPWVGRNLQEHPAFQVKALVNVKTSNMESNVAGYIKNAAWFLLRGGGPASHVLPGISFVKSRPELEYPDLEIQFVAFGYDTTEEGLKLLDRPAITLQPNVNRSRSRGRLELRSGRWQDPPVIHPNMLGDPYDLEVLVAGGKISRQILRSRAFAPYLVGEYQPDASVQTDGQWADYVRQWTTPGHHPCGTCKMGVDDQAVVDPRLRVVGVDRLRVIDSAIIPQITSGNINAISIAIGEKGAQMVREDAR
ncbi:MAG: GMC family oxidoreductase N-terminal domain-containing protein [Rhizobiales bacterium]|nr:GMC family oxidoreductase N-terminal domain-containing protein [Hyphomicrobiales bacterium]